MAVKIKSMRGKFPDVNKAAKAGKSVFAVIVEESGETRCLFNGKLGDVLRGVGYCIGSTLADNEQLSTMITLVDMTAKEAYDLRKAAKDEEK